jgi:hypothetical protein
MSVIDFPLMDRRVYQFSPQLFVVVFNKMEFLGQTKQDALIVNDFGFPFIQKYFFELGVYQVSHVWSVNVTIVSKGY